MLLVPPDPNELQLGNYNPAPKYWGISYRSYYLPMRDGVRLAVDVILPRNLPVGDKIPAILIQTRYWRLMQLRAPLRWFISPEKISVRQRQQIPFFLSHGYAFVLVDVRGTGASFGVWRHPWAEESIEDASEIVDWIVTQPWSNGRVGGMGGSYVGTTAELLGAINHPAVRCIVPMFNHPDPYADITLPGGVFNERFMRDWSELDWTLDRNVVPKTLGPLVRLIVRGVKPVDGQAHLLKQAVKEHAANGKAFEMAQRASFRDDRVNDSSVTFEQISIHRYKQRIEQSGAAIFGWGSWMDAGTADAVLRRFLTLKNAARGIIGAWEHGCMTNSSPYRAPGAPVSPLFERQLREMLRFFDAYLKGVDNGVQTERVLYYYTLGAERWQSTDRWPPKDTYMQRWYFDAQHTLSPHPPSAQGDVDTYPVDLEATTGDLNRWWEIGGIMLKPVNYSDRAEAAQHLLVYVSAPLLRDTEITGYPVVTLYMSSTSADAAIFVYLEDVDEGGRVTYVAEGQLRALHRKVSDEPAPYNLQVPHHTFTRRDAMPLVPGEMVKLTFGMHPISVLIRRGHRIRIGIAGHDQGTFARIPAVEVPTFTVARNRSSASFVDLPIRG